ncbi:signal peptidase I [Haloferula helveola]|uniref:Signal peptidase I n=1 Tax=Haloferula helveola TaxID=490095 RepID=A0ABM7RHZ1_9BACT|nr:signal peptidase I [Haloferula helveola]
MSTSEKRRFPKLAIVSIALTLILLALVLTGTVKVFNIPTGGMAPTVQSGDSIIATRTYRAADGFERGEAVIFHPPHDPSSWYVQRIVAIPGDRIEVIDGHLVVNGQAALSPEDLHSIPPDRSRLPPPFLTLAPSYPLTVPPDEFFMLGDNFENSLDSRYFGTVPAENITHTPRRIIWPLDRGSKID